ncbi:MAG: bifunctional diguanylate cyclase/phosphodiesterase [Campylobacteraceae bacterium]|nr:bifunctional diguanylate cyclase/phosphodiesterase [Campylobacteraceae bacterium]
MNYKKYVDELLLFVFISSFFIYFISTQSHELLLNFVMEYESHGSKILIFLPILLAFVCIVYAIKKYFDLAKNNKLLLTAYMIDNLTGLNNREAFLHRLKNSDKHSVILLNIIDFKSINKTFGFREADVLLIKVAKKLEKVVKKISGLKLYRVFGDEFGLMCEPGINLKELSQNIRNSFEDECLFFQENALHLSLNITYSQTSPELLTASIAMQECKENLEKYILSFESIADHVKENSNNLEMLKVIKDAISDNTIIPVYHSIVNNKTQKVFKYETLARIRKKNQELISPFHFIELSKKFKLYPEITKSIIQKAFDDFSNTSFNFSVNFSYIDIHNPEILSFFYELLENNQETASRLTIEILETENIGSYEELLSFRERIKEYGCKLAIDDFGSGYSNWVYILKLQPDYIKLDGSLIENLLDSNNNKTLVKTIVRFAKENNIKTIAEFVSSKELSEIVIDLGIDFSQGYFYSRPQELDKLEHVIK